MKKFKTEVHKRIIGGRIALFVTLFLNGVLFAFRNSFSGDLGIAISYQWGMVIGISLVLIVFLYNYELAYRNEEKLNKLYIKEHDERLAMIRLKSSNSAILASIYCLAIASAIAGYFNLVVAITLACCIYGLGIIILVCKLYYSKKY